MPEHLTIRQTFSPVSYPQQSEHFHCSGCGEDLAPGESDHPTCLRRAAIARAITYLQAADAKLAVAGSEPAAAWWVEGAIETICPAFGWRFSPAAAA